jgi:hypothetical protein
MGMCERLRVHGSKNTRKKEVRPVVMRACARTQRARSSECASAFGQTQFLGGQDDTIDLAARFLRSAFDLPRSSAC